MTVSSIVQLRSDRRQFVDVFTTVTEYEFVWDPASVGSNGEVHETVAIAGARLGDMCFLSVDTDWLLLDLNAYVSATDVVTIGIHNPTGGAINLASCNAHLIVMRPTHRHLIRS